MVQITNKEKMNLNSSMRMFNRQSQGRKPDCSTQDSNKTDSNNRDSNIDHKASARSR